MYTINKIKSLLFAIATVFFTVFSTPVTTVFFTAFTAPFATVVFTVINAPSASAQWVTGTNPSYKDNPSYPATPSSYLVRNTGNDVKLDKNSLAVHAWVCDGSKPTLSWGITCSPGYKYLYDTAAKDPDVALVTTADSLWAIVAYYSPNYSAISGAYVWEAFPWNSVTKTFVASSGQNLLETTSDGPDSLVNTINVDAYNNYFVIVWQDTAGIKADIGKATLTLSIITAPAPQVIYQDSANSSLESLYSMCPYQYTSPDVSLYAVRSDSIEVYISYIDWATDTNSTLKVDRWLIGTSSLTNQTNLFNWVSPSTSYYHLPLLPRIACAPNTGHSADDWTVVWEDHATDTTSRGYGIYGQTYSGGVFRAIQTYTRMAAPNTDTINNVNANYNPVVAYSANYDGSSTGGLMVAWNYNPDSPPAWVSSSPTYNGVEPIAVKCNYKGEIQNDKYLIIPHNPNNTGGHYQVYPSLCGRFNTNGNGDTISYVWHNDRDTTNHVPTIEYKDIPYSAGTSTINWRIKNGTTNTQQLSEIYPNPNDGSFTVNIESEVGETICIEIFNDMGQKVYSSEEVASSNSYTKQISITNLDNGIYFVKESGSLTNNSWKVVLMK